MLYINAPLAVILELPKVKSLKSQTAVEPSNTGVTLVNAPPPAEYPAPDTSMIMAPTPNNNFRFELSYFYRPDSITVSSDGTSWLGTNAPNALLYGALVEAYTFMKGSPDIMQNYQQRFEAAIDRLKNVGEGKDTKDNFRSGPVRRRPN